MSLFRHSKQQTTRVPKSTVTKKSKSKSSSPQANKVSKFPTYDQPDSSPQPAQPDSGFFEQADSDLDYDFTKDETLSAHDNRSEDFILFSNEAELQNDGYYFDEEDGLDIASVKANHGSMRNGNSNHQSQVASSTMSIQNGRFQLNVVYETPRRPEHPTHTFTYHPLTQPRETTLQQWARTHEEHEEFAWFFEQPPDTPLRTQRSQPSWGEDIDLAIYDIRS